MARSIKNLLSTSAPAPTVGSPALDAALDVLTQKIDGTRATVAAIESARNDLAAAKAARREVSTRLGEAELRGDELAISAINGELEAADRRVAALERRETAAPNARRAEVGAIEAAMDDVLREIAAVTREAHKATLARLRRAARDYLAASTIITALRLEPAIPLPPSLTDPETGEPLAPEFTAEERALLDLAGRVIGIVRSANAAADAAASTGLNIGVLAAPVRRAS